jgi:hypothetical protein
VVTNSAQGIKNTRLIIWVIIHIYKEISKKHPV